MSDLPKRRPKYPEDLRRRIVDLARAGGSTAEELSKRFGPTAQSIRNWIRRADSDAGLRSDSLPSRERAELARLRAENRRLSLEAEILGKATAWFVRDKLEAP